MLSAVKIFGDFPNASLPGNIAEVGLRCSNMKTPDNESTTAACCTLTPKFKHTLKNNCDRVPHTITPTTNQPPPHANYARYLSWLWICIQA
jgi:hypothetical protein